MMKMTVIKDTSTSISRIIFGIQPGMREHWQRGYIGHHARILRTDVMICAFFVKLYEWMDMQAVYMVHPSLNHIVAGS